LSKKNFKKDAVYSICFYFYILFRYKHNTSFVMTRLPTIRRPKVPPPAHKIAMVSANLAGCAISGQIPETNECGGVIPTINGINRSNKIVHDSNRNSSGR
jgi:hypothetical protein